MKFRLMDVLACPMCKSFPLELIIIEQEKKEREPPSQPPLCELYCAYRQKNLKEMDEQPPCEDCFKYEIKTAVLYCKSCGRWYPVINGIPHMLPDYIRKDEKKRELEFLKKYSDRIPEKIVKKGLPHNLSEQ